ncbi:MAG TPA: peptide ABC transporter substrate-binding protein [Thermomicrobiales bacterium]|nr:peptide ABC transporter substrate-binding protein [Thermomicrobiales bacterium]
MSQTHASGLLHDLFTRLTAGEISRRAFIERATALGLGAGVAMYAASVAAQTPDATQATGGAGMASGVARPEFGTENQERGEGGELKIIQWQAPSTLLAHTAGGDKDILAYSPVIEPLMHYGEDAGLVPNLVTEVPSFENGLLAEDLSSVTFHLLPDVTWSDGEPFTSADVRFTWEWVMNPENASVNTDVFGKIASIETPDEQTAVITFSDSNPLWYASFTGNSQGSVLPEHVLKDGGTDANTAFSMNPIGTGPFVVDSFSVNDQVMYSANPNYRESNKPYFQSVVLKGGGEASSAARAVLQTGEYDFAWYLQVAPDLLRELQEGGKGKLIVYPGTYAERIQINFSDPNTEVDGQRSQKDTPHPFFSDPAVREALRLGIERDKLANELFLGGDEETAAKDVISGISSLASPNTSWEYNPEKAAQVLDDAGWAMDGKVRKKDGVELSLRYVTTTNQIRQQIQAVVKQNLEDIGFKVSIENIDGSIYFDSSAGNDQNTLHFYYDMNMHQTGAGAPTPISFMENWYAGPNGENIAQKENTWSGQNVQRYQNPAYDEVFESIRTETDPTVLTELFIQLNDILIEDGAVIPLIQVAEKSAAANWLNEKNFGFGPFGYNYWNIANWNRGEDAE